MVNGAFAKVNPVRLEPMLLEIRQGHGSAILMSSCAGVSIGARDRLHDFFGG
jgi:hypothetical protein